MYRLNPKQSFLVGHHLGYVGSYFDQVLLAAQVSRIAALSTQDQTSEHQKKAKEHTENMIKNLQRVAPNFVHRLRFIQECAKRCGLAARKLPALPEEYKQWAPQVHMEFMKLWSIDDDEGWLFAHAFAAGEIRNLLIVLLVSMDLHVNFSINNKKQIASIIKRGIETLHRYEQTALRLENHEAYQVFYDQSLFHGASLGQILKMKEPAIEFFARAQKLIADLAKLEHDATESWLEGEL